MKLFLFITFIFCTMIFSQPNKTLFINGKIFTVNTAQPFADAVVVEGNKIVFVGSTQDAMSRVDDRDEIVDLKGKLMLPGFIDNHVHFSGGGNYLLGLDLRPAKSIEEFRNILKDYVAQNPGKWIIGGNWNHENWEKTDLPTKEMIDDIAPDQPVFVNRLDGHMALANSYAIKLAGVTKDTESPAGGLIVKDPKTGEPTGIFKDNAMSFIYAKVPDQSAEDNYRAVTAALKHANELGLTSIQDITGWMDLETYKKLEAENKLTCRMFTRMPISSYSKLIDRKLQIGSGSDLIKMGSLKGFADGSLGSSTAWLHEPYTQDPSTSGLPMDIISDGSMEKWCFDADANHLQLSIHSIGDKANTYMLDLFAKIKNQNPNWDRRFRLEHAQHVKFEDIPRLAEIGVIASAQPYHCIDDGVWAEKRIGPERIKYTYPFRSFLDAGVKLCFGSDWDVAPLDPILGIYAAVTRRTLDDKNPDGWVPEQKITVEEAIACYTINNAYASFEEKIKGSIEVGKLADFVVLSDDILTIDPIKIQDTKVVMTIFDGKIIYTRK